MLQIKSLRKIELFLILLSGTKNRGTTRDGPAGGYLVVLSILLRVTQ